MEASEQKSYLCQNCGERFVTKHYLLFHIRKNHPGVSSFECSTCQKSFRLATNLTIHQSSCPPATTESTDSTNSKSTKLNNNETTSATKRKTPKKKAKNNLEPKDKKQKSLKKRNKNEEENKPLDKLFKQSSSRSTSVLGSKGLKRLPNGETIEFTLEFVDGKSYQKCSFCKSLLKDSVSICELHKNRHLGIKSHKCKYCGASFYTSDALNRHIRTHTNEKPYACKYCPETFTCPQTLKFHTRAHQGIKLYQCEHCQEKFFRYCSMRNHIISKHLL